MWYATYDEQRQPLLRQDCSCVGLRTLTTSSVRHDTASHISPSSQSVPIAITTTSGSGSTSLLIYDESAPITIGILVGIGLVVFLIIAIAKRWIRNTQAASTTQETATLANDVTCDRAVEVVNGGKELRSAGTACRLNLVHSKAWYRTHRLLQRLLLLLESQTKQVQSRVQSGALEVTAH